MHRRRVCIRCGYINQFPASQSTPACCIEHIALVLFFILVLFLVLLQKKDAPCGLRGCKNGPAPFPGRMSYKATKPGLVFVLYLSMFIIVFGVYYSAVSIYRKYRNIDSISIYRIVSYRWQKYRNFRYIAISNFDISFCRIFIHLFILVSI